jgi:hypothetical protein
MKEIVLDDGEANNKCMKAQATTTKTTHKKTKI